jgi:hypothetical protein
MKRRSAFKCSVLERARFISMSLGRAEERVFAKVGHSKSRWRLVRSALPQEQGGFGSLGWVLEGVRLAYVRNMAGVCWKGVH